MVAMDANCTLVEIWRDVPGFEGRYQASNNGRIRSLLSSKILRPARNSSGYLTVNLYDGSSPRNPKSHCVHDLILATFIGTKPAGMHADHIDRNRLNNAIGNLRYAAPVQNAANSVHKKRGSVRFGSTYRGVCKTDTGRYQAKLRSGSNRYHLGTFDSAESAAKAYDAKAVEVMGEFAVLNFERNQS